MAGQTQIYYNSLCYELYLITICIDTCPNKDGEEILKNTFSELLKSIIDMSPSKELVEAIAEGGLYLLKETK